MRKRAAQEGDQPMETIPEDEMGADDDNDDELEEDEELAVEKALLEAEYIENVRAATENTD